MLKHYFKTAFRRLLNQKLYTAINIFGLAIGLAMCFIAIGHIGYEMSFEDFHQHKDNIYRVNCEYQAADTLFNSNSKSRSGSEWSEAE